MTWQSDWKGLGCGFLFGSDKIKPLSVFHLFQRDCFLSSLVPEARCSFQEQYQLVTIIDQFITTGVSNFLELFPGEMTFLGLPYPWVFCLLKKLVLYLSIICRELSDRTHNLQVAIYERPRPPWASGWVSRNETLRHVDSVGISFCCKGLSICLMLKNLGFLGAFLIHC